MFSKVVETLVGGAIGLVALFVVSKVAYAAGRADAEQATHDEMRYEKNDEDATESGAKESAVAAKKPGLFSTFKNLRAIFGRGNSSAIAKIVRDPEDHKLEAYVQNGAVHIDIRKCGRRTVPGV